MTDTISFDQEPLVPPVILDARTSRFPAIGTVFWVDQKKDTMWTMSVLVREKDVDRKLEAHIRVVHPTDDRNPQFSEQIVPTGGVDPELREFDFVVRTDTLSPLECHRLELVVSGSFDQTAIANNPDFFDFVPEEDQADRAYARWTVWEGNKIDNDPNKLIQTCDPDLLTGMSAPSEVSAP